MARVTVENCVDKIQDRFELVIVCAQRAKELYNGSPAMIEKGTDKNTVISLREIEANKLNVAELKNDILLGFRRNVVFKDTEDGNSDIEFIERQIMGETVLEAENELNNVSEKELQEGIS